MKPNKKYLYKDMSGLLAYSVKRGGSGGSVLYVHGPFQGRSKKDTRIIKSLCENFAMSIQAGNSCLLDFFSHSVLRKLH